MAGVSALLIITPKTDWKSLKKDITELLEKKCIIIIATSNQTLSRKIHHEFLDKVDVIVCENLNNISSSADLIVSGLYHILRGIDTEFTFVCFPERHDTFYLQQFLNQSRQKSIVIGEHVFSNKNIFLYGLETWWRWLFFLKTSVQYKDPWSDFMLISRSYLKNSISHIENHPIPLQKLKWLINNKNEVSCIKIDDTKQTPPYAFRWWLLFF